MSMIEPGFPRMAVLVNPNTDNSFAMRRKGALRLAGTVVVDTEGRSAPVSAKARPFEIKCEVCQAVMVVAPYIKPTGKITKALESQLRLGKLSVRLDGERIIQDVPAARHFGGPREEIPDPPLFGAATKVFLIAHHLDEDTGGPGEPIGLFLVNGCKVEVEISGVPALVQGGIEVEAGLVAALYTTLTKEQEKERADRYRPPHE